VKSGFIFPILLIDTDWVIDYLNHIERVARRLEERAPAGLALSIISLAELYEGVYYASDPVESATALQRFLDPALTILNIDEDTCKIFGKERGHLRTAGLMIGDCDLFIGATALRHNLTLLTNNRRHFERIEGLRIESV
jgi:tRNA(fMet)-specific endonuclease VapC